MSISSDFLFLTHGVYNYSMTTESNGDNDDWCPVQACFNFWLI